MILSGLLAATFTFTATATGVEKGTAVEFLFAGSNTDRAYESMFLLDEPLDAFCSRIEKSVPRGTPVRQSVCRLWPTGCRVSFSPPIERFVTIDLPEGSPRPVPVFTGGTRTEKGRLEAMDDMPAALFSTYSLPQSPIVFDAPFDQGSVYGSFKAAVTLEKGKRFVFSIEIDEKSLPRRLDLTARKGGLQDLLLRLRRESASSDVDATISFADDLTVEEAIVISRALAVIDSARVKVNGSCGLFYRAFLPLEKWRDRQERLHQPFELTIHDEGTDDLVFIDEDWTVEGNDPKLTPRTISFAQATDFPKTDTCFIYASKTQTISRISRGMHAIRSPHVVNWYVFSAE